MELWMIMAAVLLAVAFLPFFIAWSRDHRYKGVIIVLNIIGLFTGVLWIGAFIWAIWPNMGKHDKKVHYAHVKLVE